MVHQVPTPRDATSTTRAAARPSRSGLAPLALLLLLAPAALADIRYVDDSAPPGGDGLTWTTAYAHLQDALTEAAGNAAIDQIRVAQGTYYPDRDDANPAGTGDRSATFTLIDNVEIRAGYGGITEPNPDSSGYLTVLSGDLAGDDGPGFTNRADNSLHVVTAPASVGSGAVLHVVTIRGGQADGAAPDDDGAGILISGSPVIQYCTITDCEAADLGAGAYITGSGNPDFYSCTFVANRANTLDRGGAGVATDDGAGTIRYSSFTNNEAAQGAAAFITGDASLGFEGATFSGNTTSSGGGAIRIQSNTVNTTIVTLLQCNFDGNSASAGGAISNAEGTCTITNCAFFSNTAVFNGGAIVGSGVELQDIGETNIAESTFEANSAGSDGGAVSLSGQICSISCSTFTSNTAGESAGALRLDKTDGNVADCTFSDNQGGAGNPNFIGGAINVRLCAPTIFGCVFIANRCERGGAIHGGSGSADVQPARLIGCSFSANQAYSDDGAIGLSGPTGWEVASCTFDANAATGLGGAIGGTDNAGPLLFSDCRITNNTAFDGGAVRISQSASFEDCRFENNHADRLGGAIFHRADILEGNVLTARRCTFFANSVGIDGPSNLGTAAVYFADNESHADFIDCLMLANASSRGVGVAEIRGDASATFTNCILNANTAATNVATINQNSGAVPDAVTITNCTIVNNSADIGPIGGVGGAARIRSSILYGNTADGASTEATQLSPTATVDYCCVQGLTGSLAGVGNIGADPLFLDADGPDDVPATEDDDFRLTPGASPCTDAADNDADTDLIAAGVQPLPTTDFQGGDRFLDDAGVVDTGNGVAPIIDIGALESGSVAPPAPAPSDIIYVDAAATGANDGSSWTDALTDLQDALILASLDPDPFSLVVQVAQGTYTPAPPGGPAASTFIVPSGVTLQGGYDAATGLRDVALYETVLSGDLDGDDAPGFANRADNVAHVVTALCGSPTIDGCTIRGGRSTSLGGGVLAVNTSLTLDNCTVEDNESADAGGGAYVANATLHTFDTTFHANRTTDNTGQGGAIFADLRSTFYDTRGSFTANTSRSGGAIFMNADSYSRAYFYGTSFDSNNATGTSASTGLGGAIAMIGTSGHLNATTSGGVSPSFSMNSARVGGAIYADAATAYAYNTTFNQNTASEMGGAICTLGSSLHLSGLGSMTGNTAPIAAGLFAGPNVRTSISSYYAGAYHDYFSDAVVSQGQLDIGRTTLDVVGSFESTGELRTQIAAPALFGRVLATDDITLGGLLTVYGTSTYYASGYLPQVDDALTIIHGASRAGAFDTSYFRYFRFSDNRFLFTQYDSASVSVEVSSLTSSKSIYFDAYLTGLGHADIAAADLNNDGRDDLLLTSPDTTGPYSNPGFASLFFNYGNTGSTWNGWSSAVQYSVGVFPCGVAIGQLDSPGTDGPDLDAACANLYANSVSVLRNLGGSGPGWNGLGDLQSFPVGNGPFDLVIADFNLDGRSDVATANIYGNNLSILLNQGGTGAGWLGLGGRIDVPIGYRPYAIAARDIDRDGDPDLIVTLYNNRSTRVYYNNFFSSSRAGADRAVGFTEGQTIDVEDNPRDILLEDLDGDTFEDLIVVNEGSGSVSIALGLGDGTFKPAVHLPVGDNPVTICCYDAEGDGDVDLAITDVEPDGPRVIRTLRNDLDAGVLQFAEAQVLDGAENPYAVVAVDVDESGYADLVAFNDEPAAADENPPAQAAKSGAQRSTTDIAVFLNDFVPPPPPCPGDIDGDDDTDVFDFSIFAGAFGTSLGNPNFLPAADLNDDDAVDVFDFAVFAGDFGCTP